MTIRYRSDTQALFFTSDTHFGHRSMAEQWRSRRFELAHFGQEPKDAMDEHLIAQWNAVVPKDGIVFHTGDLTFRNGAQTKEILAALNGEIFLVPGNHDKQIPAGGWEGLLHVLPPLCSLVVDSQYIVMCHYALRSWNRMNYGSWMLHGHSHGNLEPTSGKQLDVGVDCDLVTESLRPLAYQEIKDYMDKQTFVRVDHHYQQEKQ